MQNYNALMSASSYGRDSVVRLLLTKKADVNSANQVGGAQLILLCLPAPWCGVIQFGETALHCACREGHAAIVQCLLQNGSVHALQDKVHCNLILIKYICWPVCVTERLYCAALCCQERLPPYSGAPVRKRCNSFFAERCMHPINRFAAVGSTTPVIRRMEKLRFMMLADSIISKLSRFY